MNVQQHRMDVLTNNLVNAETTGFKADTLVTSTFDQVMLERINDPNITIEGASPVGGYSYGTHVDELITNFSGGILEETGKSSDLALSGDGFFIIETTAGQRYTRSGHFNVNSEGYLVTEDGGFVLGENGRIRVGSGEFTVSADGTVTGETTEPDRLRLVTFDDPGVLRKEGNNLYGVFGGAEPAEATETVVRQGVLEGSNVDISEEMVNMISVYRKYEASQKIIGMTDQTLGLAVNIGRIGG
jgi:flagellar basal-body rod protein FlgG